jgi:hypothetical protein
LFALEIELGTASETQISGGKKTCKINDKNQLKSLFMSSQTFHRTPGGRIQEITAGEQFEPRILECFDLVTQELYRHLPATIHTQEAKGINGKIRAFTTNCFCLGGSNQRTR